MTKDQRQAQPRGTKKRAKLFKNGNSQAIRLPLEFRFEGATEVEITEVGGVLMISRVEQPAWSSLLKSLELFEEAESIERDQPKDFDSREEL